MAPWRCVDRGLSMRRATLVGDRAGNRTRMQPAAAMTRFRAIQAPPRAHARHACGVLLAITASACPLAHAQPGFGIGGGVTDEIDGERTAVWTASWLGRGRHPWEFSVGRLGSRADVAPLPVPATWFIAASKRLTWRRWFVSGGVALSDHDGDVLSGHGQFYTGAGYTTGPWTASLRHLSNGDTGGRNRGESFALIEYRW